jgi:plasmid stabilization system protein ParE
MRPLRWVEDALLEAEQAAAYYADIDLVLAEDWWDRLREQVALADRFSKTGMPVASVEDADVRRYLFSRFSYAIVLALAPEEVVIVAVHHQHRKPDYWRPRLAKVRP